MASILSDIGTKLGSELKALSDRLSALEGVETPVTPPSSFTINPVQWTNLSEINLSGEKAQNITFDAPPLAVGVEVEVTIQWSNSGNTALVGEVYVVDAIQNNGGLKLVGNGQTIFSNATQAQNNLIVLHSAEERTVETITEFTAEMVGREIRAVIDQPPRNLVQGETYTLTAFVNANQITHSGGANIIIGHQKTASNPNGTWELLSETIRRPYLWSVEQGTLDQDKLKLGIIKGFNDSVGVQQMFSTPLVIGTKIVVKVERSDTNSGSVAFKHIKLDGNPRGGDIHIPRDDGFIEYEVTGADMYGIRFATMFGAREITSVSVFQGEVSGGTVQANGNGGLQKIAGADAYNAGASSTNFIEGNSDGYVQFQWGAKSQKIGLTYQDVDFQGVLPFELTINESGVIVTNGANNFSQSDFAVVGDFFRIRHYASDNTIRFQKRQGIYESTTLNFASLEQNSGSNHVFAESERPFVRAINTEGSFVEGTIYRMHESSTTTLRGRIYTLDGTDLGFSNAGTKWEVVELLGTDYVTFHTHSDLTNGNNLFVDTSLFHIGSQLNDVLLAN